MSLIKLSPILATYGEQTLTLSGAENTIVGKTVLQCGLKSYESLTLATCITLWLFCPQEMPSAFFESVAEFHSLAFED